ncbi:MAG: nucleotide exchange factor GrpE [Candidatus Omnitrophica bacterium]|nr:nucleotide exchange factor GrpE [Candidatus Omnitrophota bacterium]
MMNKNIETEKKDRQKDPSKKGEKPLKEKMVKIKESEHARLIEEAAKYKEQYIRLYAEFENARKRMDREKQEFVKFANEGLIAEFLGILDNLERSVESAKAKHQDYAAFLKGIEMVMAHVHEMLKNNGVVPVEAQGKIFDPHCHEVLMQEETEEMDDGMVMEEFQKGYRLGEKVIRTAKVKVARRK